MTKVIINVCPLFIFSFWIGSLSEAQSLGPEENHPRSSYSQYSEKEIAVQVAAVRESRPQMHRGGWQWDRLLERYIDSGRKDPNELKILRAYLLSILDRYQEAKDKGEEISFTLFYNHRSWGSGGRMRIYEELVRQNMLSESEKRDFRALVLHSLRADFKD